MKLIYVLKSVVLETWFLDIKTIEKIRVNIHVLQFKVLTVNGKNGATGQSAIHLVLVLKRSEHEPAARQTRLLGKILALENPLRLLCAPPAVVATMLCESELRSRLIPRLVQLLSVQVDGFLVNLGFDDQTQETQTPRRSTSLTTCSPS